LAGAGLLVLPVRADECVAAPEVTGDASICPDDIPALDLSIPETHQAGAKRAAPEDTRPALADQPAPLPMTMSTTGTGLAVRTSLGTLQDYNAQITTRKLEAAKSMAPSSLAMPKAPAQAKPAIDVWSAIDAQGLDGDSGRRMRTDAGIDYRISKSANVGVVAERVETSQGPAQKAANDEKLAAYASFKALSAVSIDTRTEWQTSIAGSETGQASSEKGAIIVAPKVNHTFALGGGQTLEPFITVKREIDLVQSGQKAVNVDSAGAGVTLAKPDAYSLSVTTDVSGMGGAEPANVNSRLQFKLPLQ
jgi:hypothetical protein